MTTAGIILIVLGLLVRGWAIHALGPSWSTRIEEPPCLILARRPYRYLRHPAYLGSLLVLTGATMIDARLGVLWLSWAFFQQRMDMEEELLMRNQDYHSYARRVGRFGLRWRKG